MPEKLISKEIPEFPAWKPELPPKSSLNYPCSADIDGNMALFGCQLSKTIRHTPLGKGILADSQSQNKANNQGQGYKNSPDYLKALIFHL